jgi:hypothetical protein
MDIPHVYFRFIQRNDIRVHDHEACMYTVVPLLGGHSHKKTHLLSGHISEFMR